MPPIFYKAHFFLLAFFFLIGCSQQRNPSIPPADKDYSFSKYTETQAGNRYLWGYWLVYGDEQSGNFEITPLRHVGAHMNIIQFLEQSPCTNCFKIVKSFPGPDGSFYLDIAIKHPFSSLNLTAFDVRGIAMFPGTYKFPSLGLTTSSGKLGDGELLNADGYTTLFNPSTVNHGMEGYIKGKLTSPTLPNSNLNGFKRFVSNKAGNVRNAFWAGDTVTETYHIKVPKPFIFSYAIDACWAKPQKTPVVNPISDFGPNANCPEPWKVIVDDTGPGLTQEGGITKIIIDVYDWQGKDSFEPPFMECPQIFDGKLTAYFEESFIDFTRWAINIQSGKQLPPGEYEGIIVTRDIDFPNSPSWIDLSSYFRFRIEIGVSFLQPLTDVTPANLNFACKKIAVNGNKLYTASGVNGLHIFDITSPLNPVWLKMVDTPGSAENLFVSSGYAYVADEEGGLNIIDVDPPASAGTVKTVATPAKALGVSAMGGYVYVGCEVAGVAVVYAVIPEGAYWVKTIDTPGYVRGVKVYGDYVYAAAGSSGLQIIDVYPLETAFIAKEIPMGYANDVTTTPGFAYVSDGGGMQIVDVDPVAESYIAGTVSTGWGTYGACIRNKIAYVADSDCGLLIADIDPVNYPSIIDQVDLPGRANGVAINDTATYAYVASLYSPQIVDIDPPSASYYVKPIKTCSKTMGLDIDGGLLYAADGEDGLDILDIDPPELTNLAYSVDLSLNVMDVKVRGGYAYVATDFGGFCILDISPPNETYIVKSIDTPGSAVKVALSGEYAYVADRWGGLHVIDIEPPSSACIVKSESWYEIDIQAVTISGNLLFAPDGYNGIIIYRIVDPPVYLTQIKVVDTPGSAVDSAVLGNYLYVADGTSVQVINIENPSYAYTVYELETPDQAWGIAAAGIFAFVADGKSGLQLVNISSPESPYIQTAKNTPGYARDVLVSGSNVYVADDKGGVRVIKLL